MTALADSGVEPGSSPPHPFGLTDRQLGLALAFGGMLLVSTDSLITRAAEVNGWVVAFWFGVFTCPTMLFYLVIVERGRPMQAARRSGWLVLVSAALQATSTIAFIMAVKFTAIANVVVIVASVPLITAFLAWMLLKERPSLRVWLAILASLVGILVVVSGALGVGGFRGNLFALTAVVAFSFNLIIWRRQPAMSRILVLAVAGMLAAAVAWTQTEVGGQSVRTYVLLILMGTILGPTGRVAVSSATRYITAAEVSLVTPVETVAASLWAWLAFAERPPTTTFIGGTIILCAVAYGTIVPAVLGRGSRTAPG